MAMFLDHIKEMPLPAGADAAASGLAAWVEAAGRSDDAGLARRARAIVEAPRGRDLLAGIFGCSPHLAQLLQREPAFACDLLEEGPELPFATVLDQAAAAAAAQPVEAVMAALRRAKRRGALAVAVGDLTGSWELERVTAALSDLAEASLESAVASLLRGLAADGRVEIADPADPLRESGLFILGMGKLGARELNYSSDVDLIVLYDEERVRTTRPDRLNQDLVRLARAFVRVMQERTADGYVFRTDLRLRPDPASTPLAMSAHAAETYYESMGQNWERAAMLKARVVAGDREAGHAFLRHLRPFVWRRNLDFEAIRDIHSIKRQINAHRGGGDAIAVAGHNLKLGRGGIRELEFYAQTQQLIWGGRDPSLRVRGTCAALAALTDAGHVAAEARDELIEAYRFLRRVEHRLQMVADEQTHTLPPQEGLPAIARFLGYSDAAVFERELRGRLERVEARYAALFEEEAPLGGPGNLVFTGTDDDPETLRTLGEMGYREPATVAGMVRGWHHGRVRPTRSVRARELLTELMPALLEAFARTADPDFAIRKFDGFLARLPAGVQLFSLFHANPGLLALVAEIMGGSPHLAERLSRQPVVLDAVLTEDFFQPLPDAAGMAAELGAAFEQARDLQDALDVARRWANDRKFQIGVQMLRGRLDPLDACRALSDVADAVIARLQAAVEDDFAQQHGRFPGGGMGVVAFGKLGSRELTVSSDLDLVLLYDVPEADDRSDGGRPLAPAPYFIRLTQRLLTAITSFTGEGKLYDVDLRLRPSGNDGPIAVNLSGFEAYERDSAWTWEHMALTRARVVTGPAGLRERFDAIRDAVVRLPRDPAALARDAAAMRDKMRRSKPPASGWDVRNMRGGLVDLEFAAQYLILAHAHAHPEVMAGDTAETFRRLGAAGLIDPADADDLAAATELWRRLQQMLRLTGDGEFDEATASPWLTQLLARSAGADDFAGLKEMMARAAARSGELYDRLVVDPGQNRRRAAGGSE